MGEHEAWLLMLPNELHVEILGRLDITSLVAMRGVSRLFKEVIDKNEEVIIRASLLRVECIGPHRLLLQFWEPASDLHGAQHTQKQKQKILRVSEICMIPQHAKIEALYGISHICSESQTIFENVGADPTDPVIEYMREQVLSTFTTEQIQNMLSVCIRLIFKIAELMGIHVHGSPLHIDHYSLFNKYLIANGPEIIFELEKLGPTRRKEYLESLAHWRGPVPWMHEELILFLKTRGTGLLTDPAIEIQQFFQQEGTTLDLRQDEEI